MPVSATQLAEDLVLQWAVERGLQIAAEALFDAGNHILSGEFQEFVEEYGQIATRLASRGVITATTVERLRSLSGFRNILVHDYADIDLGKVVEGLGRLDDFEAFVDDVEAWLSRREGSRSGH
jgi:uncharacterized protein YutE (UPF0331/DUF86 family)